jgi:hypothetical protein
VGGSGRSNGGSGSGSSSSSSNSSSSRLICSRYRPNSSGNNNNNNSRYIVRGRNSKHNHATSQKTAHLHTRRHENLKTHIATLVLLFGTCIELQKASILCTAGIASNFEN